MTVVVAMVASMWLWLGLVPLLMLGSRRRPTSALVGEFLAGPIGLVIALGHRHQPRPR